MKKTQKRLGNKGFSLVELIVVIAIMAVLVGVLAPTLIKNVENSRKSKEGVYSNLATGKTALTITGSDGTVTFGSDASTDSQAAIAENLGTTAADITGKKYTVKLTSKDFKDKTVTYTVSTAGAVNYTTD